MVKLLMPSLFTAVMALSACATRPPATDRDATAEYEQTNDPLEPTNRFFYDVNDKLDRYTLKPAAEAYVYVVPAPVRTGVHNVLTNLSSPVLLVDDASQGNPRRAGDTFMRFVINSTAGGLGILMWPPGGGIRSTPPVLASRWRCGGCRPGHICISRCWGRAARVALRASPSTRQLTPSPMFRADMAC